MMHHKKIEELFQQTLAFLATQNGWAVDVKSSKKLFFDCFSVAVPGIRSELNIYELGSLGNSKNRLGMLQAFCACRIDALEDRVKSRFGDAFESAAGFCSEVSLRYCAPDAVSEYGGYYFEFDAQMESKLAAYWEICLRHFSPIIQGISSGAFFEDENEIRTFGDSIPWEVRRVVWLMDFTKSPPSFNELLSKTKARLETDLTMNLTRQTKLFTKEKLAEIYEENRLKHERAIALISKSYGK